MTPDLDAIRARASAARRGYDIHIGCGGESMRRHAEAALRFRRQMLREYLRLRRDRRYRAGLLQMAVTCDVISQAEWTRLDAGVDPSEVICD